MKLLTTFFICLISLIGFAQDTTDESENNTEICAINYFTQKDDIQTKFEKIYPKSELLSVEIEICNPKPIEINVYNKFNPEIMATIFILKNSSKLKRN